MTYLRLSLLVLAMTALVKPGVAQVNKCLDKFGRVIYLDVPCVYDPKSLKNRDTSPLPKLANSQGGKAGVAGKARVAHLSNSVVLQLLQSDQEFADKQDAAGQCALLAPDLTYTLSVSIQGAPAVTGGGRGELCAVQAEAAQNLSKTDLRRVGRLENIGIVITSDGSVATVNYKAVAVTSRQSDPISQMVCDNEVNVGVYGGEALFSRIKSICKSGY